MEQLAIEKLRSPRSPRRSSGSFNYPCSGSGSSTPFMSAPSSPRGCYYYSAPPSPPRGRSFDHEEEDLAQAAAVPFSWEESPGTPKRAARDSGDSPAKSSVDHLTAMGFHFISAPVSPQREFDFMDGYLDSQVNSISPLEEFEFSSARMSDADSVVSHADELFFQGQILPLKLPPRLQQKSSLGSISLQLQDISPRSTESSSFTPRARAAGSSFVHHKSSRSTAVNEYSSRAKSPSKLGQVGYRNENRQPSRKVLQQKPVSVSSSASTTISSSVRKSLRELLHINSSGSSSGGSSSGTDSQKSSRSSSGSSTSQRFSNSRSTSVSSSGSLGSARSSFSSKQVSPAPHELLQNYTKYKVSSTDELRRRTFLPYRQGLLGCLGCIAVQPFKDIQDLRH